MQKFLALTTLVAAAHAAELLADIEAPGDFEDINDGRDTAKAMEDAIQSGNPYTGRDHYKTGTYESNGTNADADVRPLCSVQGMEGYSDSQGPSDQCCRTYDYVNFEGNHRDWCLFATYDPLTWALESPKQYDLDQLGWHNDISSWKCGSKVQIEMCKHVGDVSDYNAADHTSANCLSGHQQNRDMGADADVMDQLWVKPQGPYDQESCTATLYENDDCEGPSFVIESNILTNPTPWALLTPEQQWKGSWMHYNVGHDELLKDGKIKSVMFMGGSNYKCVVEMFQAGDFHSDSITLKSDPAMGEACHQVPFIAPITDTLPHGRWSGNNLTDFTNDHVTGVHSVQIRHAYFP